MKFGSDFGHKSNLWEFPAEKVTPRHKPSFSFTPGFSQVVWALMIGGKPFKRFPSLENLHITWLKPGVNERGVDFLCKALLESDVILR